tara:strand:+ start:276 stop:494 length:219 start_codon:yes stop_codon:yes gene_type:complete
VEKAVNHLEEILEVQAVVVLEIIQIKEQETLHQYLHHKVILEDLDQLILVVVVAVVLVQQVQPQHHQQVLQV